MARERRIAVLGSGICLVIIISILVPARLAAAPQKPPAQSPQPVSDQMTNIPYYTLRDGMSSTLTLSNLVPTATPVTVTIFNTTGQAHVLPPITLAPHSFQEVQLADIAPEGFDSGNVEIAFNGISMAVTCQVSVFSVDRRVSFESREADMMDFESTSLAGILPLPKGADGFLAVTNVAGSELLVQLTAGSLKKTITLFPRETQLVKLNDSRSDAPSATLVRLVHNGLPGDIITTGYVLDLKNGYSSAFTMTDPGIMRSNRLAGAHFRAGKPDPAEGFPEGTQFRSPLLLANLSAKSVIAHVSVDYTVEDNQDTQDNGDDTQNHDVKKSSIKPAKDTVVKVRDLMIPPGDVDRVELSDALRGVGPIAEAGVDIAYDGAPGSVIGQLTSVDQTGDYAFEVPVKDPDAMNEMMESIYPWSLENGAATVLHLKNTTDKNVEADVLIRFSGGVYNPDRLDLQPYQTAAIDIQKLKDSKKPDVLGHVLPANATHGQLVWRQVVPYTMIGRVESTDVDKGMARSFSCFADCCDNYSDGFALSPTSMSGVVGDAGTFTANEEGSDCYGNYFQHLDVSANSWDSTNTAVATVNGSGYTYCAGAGTATIQANLTAKYYYWDANYIRCLWSTYPTTASSPVTVAVPTDFTQTGVQDLGNGELRFTYTWQSSTGNLADLSGCTVGEIVTVNGSNADPYAFPSPPFPNFAVHNPDIIDVNATIGTSFDYILNGTEDVGPFVKPYTAATVSQTQYIRYRCSGGSYVTMTGPISIVRTVQNSGGSSWYYQASKSGSSAQWNPLP